MGYIFPQVIQRLASLDSKLEGITSAEGVMKQNVAASAKNLAKQHQAQMSDLRSNLKGLAGVVDSILRENGAARRRFEALSAQARRYDGIGAALADIAASVDRLREDAGRAFNSTAKSKSLGKSLSELVAVVGQMDKSLEGIERDLPSLRAGRGALTGLREEMRALADRVRAIHEAGKGGGAEAKAKYYKDIVEGVSQVRSKISLLSKDFSQYQSRDRLVFKGVVADIFNSTRGLQGQINWLRRTLLEKERAGKALALKKSALEQIRLHLLEEGLRNLTLEVQGVGRKTRQQLEAAKDALPRTVAQLIKARMGEVEAQVNSVRAENRRSRTGLEDGLARLSGSVKDLRSGLEGAMGGYAEQVGKTITALSERLRLLHGEVAGLGVRSQRDLADRVRQLQGAIQKVQRQVKGQEQEMKTETADRTQMKKAVARLKSLEAKTAELGRNLKEKDATRTTVEGMGETLKGLGRELKQLHEDVAKEAEKNAKKLKQVTDRILAQGRTEKNERQERAEEKEVSPMPEKKYDSKKEKDDPARLQGLFQVGATTHVFVTKVCLFRPSTFCLCFDRLSRR